MRIKCPECELKLSADDVNIDIMVAKCTSCNNVFSFATQIDDYQEPSLYKSDKPLSVPKPNGINIKVNGDQLFIRRKWFSPMLIFMALFCVFWDGFLLIWYGIALSGGSLGMILFPLLHVAVGIFLTYSTIAGFLNTTTIAADSYELSVTHAPMPWRTPKKIKSSVLRQIYCSEKRGNKGSITYNVNAISGNEHIKLLSNLTNLEQALYIEQEIEKHLGIKNRAVRGGIN